MTKEDIPHSFSLSAEEEAFMNAETPGNHFPFLCTRYYFSLINPDDADDPVRKQILPTDREFRITACESGDPLDEEKHSVFPGLVHRYRSRCVLKVTDMCAVHCRFCFRKCLKKKGFGTLSEEDIRKAAEYISAHPGIKEILLTGGDPFMLADSAVERMLSVLKNRNPSLIIRIGTRIPVVLPRRIHKKFVSMLGSFQPLWISTHFNHPNEITGQSARAVSLFLDNGIPVLNQAVLLKEINNDVSVLETLFQELVALRVKPYYLFQGDLVKGTSHFRASIHEGLALMHALKKRLSGLSLPFYAVDLPLGGGKLVLDSSKVKQTDDHWFGITDLEGREYRYPLEE